MKLVKNEVLEIAARHQMQQAVQKYGCLPLPIVSAGNGRLNALSPDAEMRTVLFSLVERGRQLARNHSFCTEQWRLTAVPSLFSQKAGVMHSWLAVQKAR